jgi:hypothetical protein
VQRAHEIVRCDPSDERSTTGVGLDDAEELEGSQRLAYGRARDLELLGERALWRELVARPELALLQEGLDLLDDALVQPAASDGRDNGQFGPPPGSWSGGLTTAARGYDGWAGPSKGASLVAASAGARPSRILHAGAYVPLCSVRSLAAVRYNGEHAYNCER